ncbi:SRPBCC family protein [Kibdelosporangium phytohabitans]|uniref:Polyketide cyclase n=1 Tax=Kibdelosporangium phytohabitans TaxID=860235 RepID=A0A0N9IFS1_9PSEU|nr:SRPBCC family protein [Kibdelosporangium phytohabitans]ALG14141.1 hypothetical protein AOZ06_51245 [Kibdelosporangium phytohabitans]MBE1466873.1 uncharacterized protein YndB with AHSA1/START domain [Kibdelosporangium phytohabitans]
MAKQEFEVTVHSAAPPGAVYQLLRDGSTWPVWSPLERFELEKPGSPEPESVGAIRNFHTGRYKVREQVAELVPDRRFSYTLLSGLALKDYRADVDLTPSGEGTDIRWHTSFRPKVPGMGWIYRRALHKLTTDVATGLASYAAGK